MRLLVITRSSWSNNNSVGNTMTNFFSDFKECEIHNLYFRSDLPNNDVSKSYYHITEKQLLRSVLHHSEAGKVVDIAQANGNRDSDATSEQNMYNRAKKHNSVVLMFLRELIWDCGHWKNDNLKKYLDYVSPDVIFMPVFGCYYPHKVLKFIKKQTNAAVVMFHADDNYTLRQFSLSPIYWLYRFGLRRNVRKSVESAALNYCISNIQKKEYEKCFKKEFKILTKGADFYSEPPIKKELNFPLQFVFTGNINCGRWKSLAEIARNLNEINKNGIKAQLKIYTMNSLTSAMDKALNLQGSSEVMGGVMASEVAKIQSDADVLVHIEALERRNRLQVHQSFSTKLVDYFHAARCIFAVGTADTASIEHLIVNNAAIVATNKAEIQTQLVRLTENQDLLNIYADKAWKCGKNNHDINYVHKILYSGLLSCTKKH